LGVHQQLRVQALREQHRRQQELVRVLRLQRAALQPRGRERQLQEQLPGQAQVRLPRLLARVALVPVRQQAPVGQRQEPVPVQRRALRQRLPGQLLQELQPQGLRLRQLLVNLPVLQRGPFQQRRVRKQRTH
jgi:hypothetical protein